jgi:hypothetical protein
MACAVTDKIAKKKLKEYFRGAILYSVCPKNANPMKKLKKSAQKANEDRA